MPDTAHYRLRQKDAENNCRCSADALGPGDLGWPNQPQTYTAKCADGGWQKTGDQKTVTVPAGTYHAETLAAANSLALVDARTQAQALLECSVHMVFHRGQPKKLKAMPDGKVICAGIFNFLETLEGDDLSSDFLWPMIYRVDDDGAFDPTFTGFTTVPLCDADGNLLDYSFGASEGVNQAWDFGFDSTGRIYVVGLFCFKLSGVVYSGIARFSADGVFDATFLCRFSNQGFLNAPVYTIAVVNDDSIFCGGTFDNYAKGNGSFVQTISLVNIDHNRTAVGTIPVGTVYTTLWNPFCSVYKLGRLYLGTTAPQFEFAGGSGKPPSALNVAGGGLVRVTLNSVGRLSSWRNVASIPYYPPGSTTDHVLAIDMDDAGNLYLVGLFSSFGKVPLLGGVIPGSIGYTGDNVPRLNVVKTDATGTIDPNFKPAIVAAGDFAFGLQVVKVLPDHNILISGGAAYIDPSNPFPDQIVKLNPKTGAVISTYPDMEGLIYGFPYAVDATRAGEYLYIAGVGGFVLPESPAGAAIQRFKY